MTDYKWIKTNRNGLCTLCHTQLQPGNDILWSLTDKSKVWCRKCGEQFQPYQAEEAKQEQKKEQAQASTYKCDWCGELSTKVSYHYNKSNERYCVCEFCRRVVLCQHHAKIAGLWFVYRSPGVDAPEVEKP